MQIAQIIKMLEGDGDQRYDVEPTDPRVCMRRADGLKKALSSLLAEMMDSPWATGAPLDKLPIKHPFRCISTAINYLDRMDARELRRGMEMPIEDPNALTVAPPEPKTFYAGGRYFPAQ